MVLLVNLGAQAFKLSFQGLCLSLRPGGAVVGLACCLLGLTLASQGGIAGLLQRLDGLPVIGLQLLNRLPVGLGVLLPGILLGKQGLGAFVGAGFGLSLGTLDVAQLVPHFLQLLAGVLGILSGGSFAGLSLLAGVHRVS